MTRPNEGSSNNKQGRSVFNTRKRSLSSSTSSSSINTPSSNLFSPSQSATSNSTSSTTRSSIETRSSQKRRQTLPSSDDSDMSSSSPQPSSSDNSSTTSATSIPQRIFVQRNVPAFLNKLYSMVNDPSTDNLIHWSKDGNSFIVEGHEQFAKSVLPRFYKHNTFASFVRQLNMYDFHKIPHLQQGVLISDSKHERWEFSNPNFQRGRPEMLVLVTRKRNRERGTDDEEISLASLVKDIAAIRKHQISISNELHTIQQDNAVLWEDTLTAREKHQRHQEVIGKILQFLTIVFSNNDRLPSTATSAFQQQLGDSIQNITPAVSRQLIKEAATLAGMAVPEDNPSVKDVPGKCSSPSKTLSTIPFDILTTAKEKLYLSSIINNQSSAGPTISSEGASSSATLSTMSTPSTIHSMNSSGNTIATSTPTSTISLTSTTSMSYPVHVHPPPPATVAGPNRMNLATTQGGIVSSTPLPAVANVPYTMLHSTEDDNHYARTGPSGQNSGITDIEGGAQSTTQTVDTAARSVQAIAQDIEDLQVNVEALADDLGINPGQLVGNGDFSGYYDQFTDDYSRLIASATQHDRNQLFELASHRYHLQKQQHNNNGNHPPPPTPFINTGGNNTNNSEINGQQLANRTIAARRACSASRPHRVPSPVLRTSVESSFCTSSAPSSAISQQQQQQPANGVQPQQQQQPALVPVPVPVPVAMIPTANNSQQAQQYQAQFAQQLALQQQQFPVLSEDYMAFLTAQAQQTYVGMAAAAAANSNNVVSSTTATTMSEMTTSTIAHPQESHPPPELPSEQTRKHQ